MRGAAVKLDGHAERLIENVAVLGAAAAPDPCLPASRRQAVQSLHITAVTVLKRRVDAFPVGSQSDRQIRMPAHSHPRVERGAQP